MNLGVYISTLNEEVLIEDTLSRVVEVFPQVEVIDLGSTDLTLECLRRFDIPIHQHTMPSPRYKRDSINAGTEWTRLKNYYANKHDWVFFIDGDEIYNEENLLKVKMKLETGSHTAYRVGWKNVRKAGTQIQQSSIVVNGPKLYKTSDYEFYRAWPKEVLQSRVQVHNKEPKEDCDIWCWHGVLLERTHSISEMSARIKKRVGKAGQYNTLDWEDLYGFPWV